MSEYKTCDQWVEHLDERSSDPLNNKEYQLVATTWEVATKSFRQPDTIPVKREVPYAYAVIDHKGQIDYTVTVDRNTPIESEDWARRLCHEHINDAAGHGVEGAGKWVVRKLLLASQEPQP
jgi:hypothetical protein